MKLLFLITLLSLSTVASFAHAQSGGRYKQDIDDVLQKIRDLEEANQCNL